MIFEDEGVSGRETWGGGIGPTAGTSEPDEEVGESGVSAVNVIEVQLVVGQHLIKLLIRHPNTPNPHALCSPILLELCYIICTRVCTCDVGKRYHIKRGSYPFAHVHVYIWLEILHV